MARLEIRELTKVFTGENHKPVLALDRISLEVADKQWLAVTGPSGCGKTTLLRLIAGLDQPASGDILLEGRSLLTVRPEKRNVAMVFQEPALYPHMTVFQNIGFGLKLRHYPDAEIRQKVEWAAEMLEISECLPRKPMELSGGQRHRVAVARALVRRPDVFLFDEPLESLDAPTREEVRQKLQNVCRAADATVIYVTHNQAEAMVLGDKLAILDRGRLQQHDKPLAAYTRPANLFAAQFLGSPPMNLLEGVINEDGDHLCFQSAEFTWRLQVRPESIVRFAGKRVVMGIRPEDFRLAGRDQGDTQVLEATVASVEELGGERRLHLLVGGRRLIARVPMNERLIASAVVRVQIGAEAVRFFDPESTKAIL